MCQPAFSSLTAVRYVLSYTVLEHLCQVRRSSGVFVFSY